MQPLDEVAVSGDWLSAPQLQTLFDILLADGGEALIAGGAVRNSLMDRPVHEADLSTTWLPEDVIARLRQPCGREICFMNRPIHQGIAHRTTGDQRLSPVF